MAIFQEWECDSFLYDPKRLHWHDIIKKSPNSKVISPRFYSAIDTVPKWINGKAYFRYWPFIDTYISYDSLMQNTPPVDSSDFYLPNHGVTYYPYFLIREEDHKILFLSPYYFLAHKYLKDSPNIKEEKEWVYKEVIRDTQEHVFWDIQAGVIDTASNELGRLKEKYVDERNDTQVHVFTNGRRIHKYNICVEEFHLTTSHGIIGFKLYNRVIDNNGYVNTVVKQECDCILR